MVWYTKVQRITQLHPPILFFNFIMDKRCLGKKYFSEILKDITLSTWPLQSHNSLLKVGLIYSPFVVPHHGCFFIVHVQNVVILLRLTNSPPLTIGQFNFSVPSVHLRNGMFALIFHVIFGRDFQPHPK